MMYENMRFHHIGIATNSLSREKLVYDGLGYRVEGEVFHDPLQQVRGLFMTHGAMRIELLEPDSPESSLHTILKSRQKMYHQCFECERLYEAIRHLEASGARVVSPPKPAVAFGGRSIAFLMLPNLMLIELVGERES